MNALTAPIQHIQPGEILFAIPFVPLAAAAINGLFGERIAATRGSRATDAIAVIANLGALAAALSVLYTLFGLPSDQRYLFSHLWSFVRILSLSASVDLGADPLGASLASVVMVLALVAHLDLSARDARPSHHARVSLLSGGLALAFLGDGIVPLVLGLGAATVAIALLGAPSRARSILVTGAVADAAILAGAAVLFWALGGGWGIDVGNEPTFTRHNPMPARVQTSDIDIDDTAFGPTVLPIAFSGTIPVPASSAPKPMGARIDPGAKGKITLAGLPGAKLYLRGSNVPAAIAPIVGVDSFAGRMDMEVERPGMSRAMLRAVEVPAYGEIVLVPMGPTLSFRELYDQLALTDVTKKHFVRDLLDPTLPTHRRLFGRSVVNVAGILFGIAALVRGALFPFLAAGALEGDGDPRTRALLFAVLPIPAVFLLSRVAPVLALGSSAPTMILVFGALSALFAAVVAASRATPLGAIRAAIASQGALALAGAGAGGFGAGVAHVVVVAFAAMTLVLVHDLPGAADKDSHRARASLLATLVLAGAPIPLLGVAWSREAVLQRLFGAGVPFHLGYLAWLLGVVSVGLVAHALVRVHRASFPAEGAGELDSWMRNALFGLFLGSAIAAVVLVIAQTNVGVGPERPLYESWLVPDVGRILGERAPHAVELGRGVELGIAGVTIAVAVLGARLAQRGDTLFGAGVESVARVPWSIFAGFVEGLGAVGRFVDFALDLPLRIAGGLARRRR
jgi:NADH-quinone oxidoreductase subunit L